MKAFLCHSSYDSAFVIEVAKYLKPNLEGIYYYEDYQRSDESFVATIGRELDECEGIVVFLGSSRSACQIDEASRFYSQHLAQVRKTGEGKHFVLVYLDGRSKDDLPKELNLIGDFPHLTAENKTSEGARRIATAVVHAFGKTPVSDDDLPDSPYLFGYEKDIIAYFIQKARLDSAIAADAEALQKLPEDDPEHQGILEDYVSLRREFERDILPAQMKGCPAEWPVVVRSVELHRGNEVPQDVIGNYRDPGAGVLAAALTSFHCEFCMGKGGLTFPEAGPRAQLAYPRQGRNLKVAILVSGGIAPGTNAVIDGITQRHRLYADYGRYQVQVHGYRNGFQAFDDLDEAYVLLDPANTLEHASEGGSLIGTSRYGDLLKDNAERDTKLEHIVSQLVDRHVDILYVIGGDGSMRGAHAIWSYANRRPGRKLSVVAIPKTMDNDILWMWQTFGFLSAVERARELVEQIATEVTSNPRLGVVQLFGSDSGYVVSHAVLAAKKGICDAALIPEVDFSMLELAKYLKTRMVKRAEGLRNQIPHGFVVMAETAIPTDALDFLDDPAIELSTDEKEAVRDFDEKRRAGVRIEGQTNDALRTAGLKIVSRGLLELIRTGKVKVPDPVQPNWEKLRIVTNEPRHLLRTMPPATVDIINAQRLGLLAVDNALAGYTDFMVSQWLTEYVLVPLKLVVLGRKRIPTSGIFWKSVLAKTGQPSRMA